jgi:hypothetical protein
VGQRSRRRERSADAGENLRRGYARGEARNEAIRQGLQPLAARERPGAVTVAVVVALALALANTVALLLGETLTGDANISGVGLSIILLVAAIGMWRSRYWAVLGFQALLTLQIIVSALALMVATDWRAAVVLTVLIVLGGWLFWKLVRAMARLQMPERP